MKISTYTLRYYDREGLLPFVDRSASGRREFKDNDFNYLEVINCLREAGVPVRKIADFIDMCMAGDKTLDDRDEFLAEQETDMEAKMAEMQKTLDFLRWKKWYYKTAVEAGTEEVHFTPGTNHVDPATREHYDELIADGGDPKKLVTLKD